MATDRVDPKQILRLQLMGTVADITCMMLTLIYGTTPKRLKHCCVTDSEVVLDCSNLCKRRHGFPEMRGSPKRGGHRCPIDFTCFTPYRQCLSRAYNTEVRFPSPYDAAQKAACRLTLMQEATNHLAV